MLIDSASKGFLRTTTQAARSGTAGDVGGVIAVCINAKKLYLMKSFYRWGKLGAKTCGFQVTFCSIDRFGVLVFPVHLFRTRRFSRVEL
jgi:hypothetical protein